MSQYRVRSLDLQDLWGYRTVALDFHPDVTIVIGENGTGKTTILNILRGILTADRSLFSYRFTQATVELSAFSDHSPETVVVSREDNVLKFRLSWRTDDFVLHPSESADNAWILNTLLVPPSTELTQALKERVQVEWLPVSRRSRAPRRNRMAWQHSSRSLTTVESADDQRESVDYRLAELRESLSHYRLRLDSRVSEQYRVFERKVLAAILYRADYDSLGHVSPDTFPDQEDQDELLRVFEEVDILDADMRRRIEAHFAKAKEALEKIQSKAERHIDDFFIIPLIRRTQALVNWAREQKAVREEIFAPLQRYENIVNGFLRGKRVEVNDDGQLTVSQHKEAKRNSELSIDQLSSGEKQILVLLTAGLMRRDSSIVYIADEPELSLHVTWQAELLRSLVEIGGTMQVIVATHSPDIAGMFRDNILELRHD